MLLPGQSFGLAGLPRPQMTREGFHAGARSQRGFVPEAIRPAGLRVNRPQAGCLPGCPDRVDRKTRAAAAQRREEIDHARIFAECAPVAETESQRAFAAATRATSASPE